MSRPDDPDNQTHEEGAETSSAQEALQSGIPLISGSWVGSDERIDLENAKDVECGTFSFQELPPSSERKSDTGHHWDELNKCTGLRQSGFYYLTYRAVYFRDDAKQRLERKTVPVVHLNIARTTDSAGTGDNYFAYTVAHGVLTLDYVGYDPNELSESAPPDPISKFRYKPEK